MADITFGFTCPDCGMDLGAEIIVESHGCGPSGMGGPPEFSSPGEGPEYYLEADVVCNGTITEDESETPSPCGKVFDDDYFHTGKVQDQLIERICEPPEYDYDGPDTLEERNGDV